MWALYQHGERMNNSTVSVIIPVYNEEKSLESFLREVKNSWKTGQLSGEILIVDDGSTDTSPQIIEEFTKHCCSARHIRFPENHGKGFVVTRGIEKAQCSFCIIIDGDGAFSPDYIILFLKLLNECDCVLGRKTGYPLYRSVLSRTFNFLVKLLFSVPTSDVLCGIKGFRTRILQEILPQLNINDWLYDVILLATLPKNLHIKLVDVIVRDNKDSKFRFSDPIRLFLKLIILRLHH